MFTIQLLLIVFVCINTINSALHGVKPPENSIEFSFTLNQSAYVEEVYHRYARISTIDDGFVIVYQWREHKFDPHPILTYFIKGKLFDADGNMKGEEFTVAQSSLEMLNPQVTQSYDGKFMVTFEYGKESEEYDVFGRLMNITGEPYGEIFRINQNAIYAVEKNQDNVFPTSLGEDGFIFLWDAQDQDGSGNAVFGRFYDKEAVPRTNEFQVNTHTPYSQDTGSAAFLDNGNLFVVWESTKDDEDEVFDVRGQMLNKNGEKIGEEIIIPKNTTYFSQDDPTITTLHEKFGGFVVVWEEGTSDNYQIEDYSIGYGQVFDSNGNKLYEEFEITNTTANDQYDFLVVATFQGFFVCWEDSSEEEIFGQHFNEKGEKIGSEMHLSHNSKSAVDPRATVLPNNDVVVVWENDNEDGYGGIILKSLVECILYCGENEIFDEELCQCHSPEIEPEPEPEPEGLEFIWIPISISVAIGASILFLIFILIAIVVVVTIIFILKNKKSSKNNEDVDKELESNE